MSVYSGPDRGGHTGVSSDGEIMSLAGGRACPTHAVANWAPADRGRRRVRFTDSIRGPVVACRCGTRADCGRAARSKPSIDKEAGMRRWAERCRRGFDGGTQDQAERHDTLVPADDRDWLSAIAWATWSQGWLRHGLQACFFPAMHEGPRSGSAGRANTSMARARSLRFA